MPTTDAVSGQSLKQQVRDYSSVDINRKSDERWHLENPHNKALPALFYASLLRRAWQVTARCGAFLFHLRRVPHPQALSQTTSEHRQASGS
jgi:hypothetical protein